MTDPGSRFTTPRASASAASLAAGGPDWTSRAAARVLIADDSVDSLKLLQRILTRSGYENVRAATTAGGVLNMYVDWQPDIVLLDLHMPGIDGLEILRSIRDGGGEGAYVPVVMLTGDASPEARDAALSAGATDFITKPYDTMNVVLRVQNLLEIRSLQRALVDRNAELEERVRQRTAELLDAQLDMLDRLAAVAEARDGHTAAHTRRVGELAAKLAKACGGTPDGVELIRLAAPLHDIGKIAMPDHILHKPGSFTPDEFEVMKTHTLRGAEILTQSHSPVIMSAEQIALSHHEWWDGSGYPHGLTGAEIPWAARIVAVADVYDAVTDTRVYRGAFSPFEAAGMIRDGSGTHFDPVIVDAFIRLFAEGEIGLSVPRGQSGGGLPFALAR